MLIVFFEIKKIEDKDALKNGRDDHSHEHRPH